MQGELYQWLLSNFISGKIENLEKKIIAMNFMAHVVKHQKNYPLLNEIADR